MSQDYPSSDNEQETRRRSSTPRLPVDRQPPPGPMARPVFPHADKTEAHRLPDQPLPPEPESSGLYVPWWGFVLVILAVAGITCGLWGVVLVNRGNATTSLESTPTITFVVITPTVTLGAGPIVVTSTPPSIGPTSPPFGVTPTVGTGPTSAPVDSATAVPGIPIATGVTIVVAGTEGQGLTVRQGPGTDYTYVFIANDGEKFNVTDGPRDANGYTWWYIVDPGDQNRFGWAVENFMQVVQ